MAKTSGAIPSQFSMTVRLVQGYRYLDRCGLALVRLEEVLEDNWIPEDITPKGGTLKNDDQAMLARFDSEAITVLQHDFLNFERFHDAACRIYESLTHTFEIERINAPVLRVVFQKAADSIEEAERDLATYNLVQADARLLQVLGPQTTFQFTMTSELDTEWRELAVLQRRRLNAAAIKQVRRIGFDDRLMRRTRLLPKRQQIALKGIMNLRKEVREVPEFAVQFDLEQCFETEIHTKQFDIASFLRDSWDWHNDAIDQIVRGRKRQ